MLNGKATDNSFKSWIDKKNKTYKYKEQNI